MMTPHWKDALPVAPRGFELQELWMTSFDQPDSSLLVEHLLPSLLGANHPLSPERTEKNLFFGELTTALESLHGRLSVISSPPRGTRESSPYPWLWRYVSHFTVGAEELAVQHAKLWAFHWKSGDTERLELHVSSTNLTTSAFKGQIQAGWHLTLELGARRSLRVQQTWGELVPFLEALGASAGEEASRRLQRLVSLLGRVSCPEDVTFVASVPGQKRAARQLAQLDLSEVHVFAPTIGEWNGKTLSAWSSDVGVSPKKLHLKWISTTHPWAAGDESASNSGWTLSPDALESLTKSGVQIECLPSDGWVTEQLQDNDPRWSHAKLYLLRSRQKRRLLLTSANWSVSAWGAGKTAPRNFELGVLFESEWTQLEDFDEPFRPPATVPFCVERDADELIASSLEWAEASWDGKRISLRVRTTDSTTAIKAFVSFEGGLEKRVALNRGRGSLSWSDAMKAPLVARFQQAGETLEVDVLDLRPPAEFKKTPLPEVDPELEKKLREAFLLQRYGGLVVTAETLSESNDERDLGGGSSLPADYSVQAWVEARAAFGVVDKWRAVLNAAVGEAARREQILMDGEALRAVFEHRDGTADVLVAEELGWRLEGES